MPEPRPAPPIPAKSDATLSDGDLVRRATGGDAWAEEVLYRRHARRVLARCGRILGSEAEAEDALQDAFITALDRLEQLRDPDAFAGWLDRIAVNRVYAQLRRRKFLALFGLRPPDDGARLDNLASGLEAETKAELAKLARVLEKMPAKNRVAWVLRYVEGETLPEIARLTDTSLATAKRRVRAAREVLTEHVRIGGEDD